MFTFNEDFTHVRQSDRNFGGDSLTPTTLIYLNGNGMIEWRGIGEDEAKEVMKRKLIAIDVDGGVIRSVSTDSKGIKIEYDLQSADVSRSGIKVFEHDWPIAICRGVGAFALAIYDPSFINDDGGMSSVEDHEPRML